MGEGSKLNDNKWGKQGQQNLWTTFRGRSSLTIYVCMQCTYETLFRVHRHTHTDTDTGEGRRDSLSVSTISQIGRLGKKAPLPYGPYSCSCCMSIAVPYLFINIAFHFIHCPLLYGTQFTDKGVNMSPTMIFEQFVSLEINNYSTLNVFSTFLTH